jgi:hypothetical protein
MRTANGTIPIAVERAETSRAVTAIARFLLRVEYHEGDGLTRRCAVLAAASEQDIDPAAVLRATEDGTP